MKKFLVFGLTALVLFAASGSVSYLMRKARMPKEATPETQIADTPSPPDEKHAAEAPSSTPKTAIRPPPNPAAEDTAKLAESLRARETAVQEQEARLAARRKTVELVYHDIRTERAAIDALRKQLNDEARALEDKLSRAERRAANRDDKPAEAMPMPRSLPKEGPELKSVDRDNIRKLAAVFKDMAPDNAARILQQLVEAGKMDTAVELLAALPDREAAHILAEFNDAKIAAQIVDRLKRTKLMAPPGSKK